MAKARISLRWSELAGECVRFDQDCWSSRCVFDWLNNMDTAAEVSRGALGFTDERLGMHGATSWRSVVEVRQLLHGLEISQRDVFMDVGCGKGSNALRGRTISLRAGSRR